jgi:hypothetical protein
MSEIRYTPKPREEENKATRVQPEMSQKQQIRSRPSSVHRSVRFLAMNWFVLAVVILVAASGLTLIQAGILAERQTNALPPVSLASTRTGETPTTAADNLWFTAGGGQQDNYLGEIIHL